MVHIIDYCAAAELLPTSSNEWYEVCQQPQEEIKECNVLEGPFCGINRIGQSLNHHNIQLKGEPPIPRVVISPWLNSVTPDTSRKFFEIGEC